jgi:hypothetical protein
VNAVALTIMVSSGLRIFNSYPAFARKGECPFEGRVRIGLKRWDSRDVTTSVISENAQMTSAQS